MSTQKHFCILENRLLYLTTPADQASMSLVITSPLLKHVLITVTYFGKHHRSQRREEMCILSQINPFSVAAQLAALGCPPGQSSHCPATPVAAAWANSVSQSPSQAVGCMPGLGFCFE